MKTSTAEILREYGPFPSADHVHGVTFDGQHVWFASGDKLNAFDPATGKPVRSIDVASHAGTAFDGQHLFQIAEDRIQKIDPKTGRVLSTIPAPGGGGDSGACMGGRDALGGAAPRPEDPSNRSRNRSRSSHDRIQPRRYRRHLDRGRTLARHLGGRRERREAGRSSNGTGPGEAPDAAWSGCVGARIRWRRSVLLRRRKQREGESRPPTQARLRGQAEEVRTNVLKRREQERSRMSAPGVRLTLNLLCLVSAATRSKTDLSPASVGLAAPDGAARFLACDDGPY